MAYDPGIHKYNTRSRPLPPSSENILQNYLVHKLSLYPRYKSRQTVAFRKTAQKVVPVKPARTQTAPPSKNPKGNPNKRGDAGPSQKGPEENESTSQKERRIISGRIKKTWPIPRRSRLPRGLGREGNSCYRLSGLQTLLHLPKFLNWLQGHNEQGEDGELDWPCAKDIPESEDGTRCIPCMMKRLAREYWGAEDLTADGIPQAFASDHPAILPIHNLVPEWFERGYAQQDVTEFFLFFFNKYQESVYEIDTLHNEFKALFETQLRDTRRFACGHTEVDANRSEGFHPVRPLPEGQADSLYAAIQRSLDDQSYQRPCNTCKKLQDCKTTRCFMVGPEYLCITLDLSSEEAWGNQPAVEETQDGQHRIKNQNPIKIPSLLDLTRLQDEKDRPYLHYRLLGALYHSGGTMDSGHYIAGVRTASRTLAQRNAHINDHVIAYSEDQLTNNPLLWESTFNVTVLWYERIPNKVPKDETR